MSVPKNGRSTQAEQQLPEGAVLFDSDTELSEEQLEVLRAKAEGAQKDAQIATLTAQLLTTRNELIRAKKTIEKLVEERDGKNSEGKRSKNQAGALAQNRRRAASKESKSSGAGAKRAGGGKSR